MSGIRRTLPCLYRLRKQHVPLLALALGTRTEHKGCLSRARLMKSAGRCGQPASLPVRRRSLWESTPLGTRYGRAPEDLTDRQAAKLADIASHGKPLHRGPQGVDLRGGGPQIQHRPSGERRQPPAATVAPWQDIRPLRVCPASAACRTDRSNRGDAERSSCEVATPCPERRPAVESSQPMDGVGEHGWGRV
jgi:hypothetical protein